MKYNKLNITYEEKEDKPVWIAILVTPMNNCDFLNFNVGLFHAENQEDAVDQLSKAIKEQIEEKPVGIMLQQLSSLLSQTEMLAQIDDIVK